MLILLHGTSQRIYVTIHNIPHTESFDEGYTYNGGPLYGIETIYHSSRASLSMSIDLPVNNIIFFFLPNSDSIDKNKVIKT